MATVAKGAKAADSKAKAAVPGGLKPSQFVDPSSEEQLKAAETEGDAERLRKALEEEQAKAGVVYVADADHLFIYPPRPLFASDGSGRVVDNDPGLFVDFAGVGRTREFHPDKDALDKAFCARLDEAIASNQRDCVKFHIRRLEPGKASPPVERWDRLSVSALKGFVEAKLGDDHDANVRFVKECAKYETENKNRDDVLGMLDGVIVGEAALSSAFDAEVRLA